LPKGRKKKKTHYKTTFGWKWGVTDWEENENSEGKKGKEGGGGGLSFPYSGKKRRGGKTVRGMGRGKIHTVRFKWKEERGKDLKLITTIGKKGEMASEALQSSIRKERH